MVTLPKEDVIFLTQNEKRGNIVSLEKFGVCTENGSCYFKLYFRGDLDPREQKYGFPHDDHQSDDWKDGYRQLKALWEAFHAEWTRALQEDRAFIVPDTCTLYNLNILEPTLSPRLEMPNVKLYEWGHDWVLQGCFGHNCNVAHLYSDLQHVLDFMFEMIGKEGRSREAQDERLEADDLQGLSWDATDSYYFRKMEDTMINEAEQYMLGNFIETKQEQWEKKIAELGKSQSSDNNNVDRENLPF